MRCPIHQGDNPTSFSLNEKTGFAKCFRCGWAGGKLELIVQLGLASNKKEAFRWAADLLGVVKDGFDPRVREIERRLRRDAIRLSYWLEHLKFSADVASIKFRAIAKKCESNIQDDWREPTEEQTWGAVEWEARSDMYAAWRRGVSNWKPTQAVTEFREWETQHGAFKEPKYLIAANRFYAVMFEDYDEFPENKITKAKGIASELKAMLDQQFGDDAPFAQIAFGARVGNRLSKWLQGAAHGVK